MHNPVVGANQLNMTAKLRLGGLAAKTVRIYFISILSNYSFEIVLFTDILIVFFSFLRNVKIGQKRYECFSTVFFLSPVFSRDIPLLSVYNISF